MSANSAEGRLKDEPRYRFPVCGKGYSGWKDYDRPVLEGDLCLEDRLAYLRSRLDLICFNSLDRVYLRSSSHHSAVNGPEMSFFILGTTVICCAVEALGGFVLNNHRSNGVKFRAFLDKYMPEWSASLSNGSTVRDWLWDNLRNGLAHGFVIKNGGMEDLKMARFQEQAPGKVLIHAEMLYQDLKVGKDRYIAEVAGKSDIPLTKNFEKHFQEVFQTF